MEGEGGNGMGSKFVAAMLLRCSYAFCCSDAFLLQRLHSCRSDALLLQRLHSCCSDCICHSDSPKISAGLNLTHNVDNYLALQNARAPTHTLIALKEQTHTPSSKRDTPSSESDEEQSARKLEHKSHASRRLCLCILRQSSIQGPEQAADGCRRTRRAPLASPFSNCHSQYPPVHRVDQRRSAQILEN